MDCCVAVAAKSTVAVGVSVGVKVGVRVGVEVGVKVGVLLGEGVIVGSRNCPGPQPEIIRLTIRKRMEIVRCFVFMVYLCFHVFMQIREYLR